MNKYNAQRTTVDGIKFHSKGESERYQELKILQMAGQIENLELQPEFLITINDKMICKVILDFSYLEDGRMIFEDFKGMDTDISRLKRKFVEAQYGIEVRLTGRKKRVTRRKRKS